MDERKAKLDELVADICEHEAIADAFLAKSFTDRLVIIDVGECDEVPESVVERLAENGLHAAEGVYGDDEDSSFAGSLGDGARHHFVDVQTRGSHQSYVVE